MDSNYLQAMGQQALDRLNSLEEEWQKKISIGGKIKTIRTVYGLMQKEFASMIQVTHAHISKIENGKDSPSNSLLTVISSTFNINENWLTNNLNVDRKEYDRFIFNDFTTFVDNTIYLQTKFGLKKREMESLFSISAYHLDNSHYLRLKGVPEHAIKAICKYFGVSMYDIINTTLDNTPSVPKEVSSDLTLEEQSIIEIYKSCSPKDKKLIIALLDKFQ